MALILIVDDEALISLAYENALRDAGHAVLTAADGRRALDVMARDLPDLVITDYMMPRMDGAGLVEAMRADPRLAAVPIIMNTSLTPDVIERKGLPVQELLRKPVRAETLLSAVDRVLNDAA